MDAQRLAQRLRGLREHRGYTQEQAAEALGLTRSTLAMMETNRRRMHALELVPIARLYGISVGEILGEGTPGDFEDLCAVAHRLTPEHRDQLVRYARFLKELER
jgi:transcriptional regulator with XRE-family HTH domain